MSIVADRYSQALFELAQEAQALLHMEEEVSAVLSVFKEQPDLVKFLDNPLVTGGAKIDLLEKILGQDLDKSVLHFMFVMIQRNRAFYIREALAAFIDKSREARGIVQAIVRVVEPLSAAQEQELLAKLQTITGKTVMIETRMDPSLIGGLVVQIGDMRIDGSVARRLEEMKKTLLHDVAQ